MALTERISLADATTLITDALTAQSLPRPAAQSVARALVAAEAEGQVGHGFSRLDDYAAQVRSGKINRTAQVQISAPSPAALLVDAGNGFAYPAMDAGIAAGAELAQKLGTATIAITRSHHCGALSVQVEKLARQGLVAIMVANAPAAMAPWGARQAVFGTNPIAFAAPRGPGEDPLVIDLSLSRVARGKVMSAHKAGTTIPEGWALDAEGNPTTDPAAALGGTMVPIGEAKGTALALIVEILAAVMTGANFSTDASSFFVADGPPPGVGQFLIAMRPPEGVNFIPRLEMLLGLIDGLEGARLPGTRRKAAITEARTQGLEVPTRLLDIARALAAATD